MRYNYKLPKTISFLTKHGSKVWTNNVMSIVITEYRITFRNADNEPLAGVELENMDSWVVTGDTVV
jgi:hypothetical protein